MGWGAFCKKKQKVEIESFFLLLFIQAKSLFPLNNHARPCWFFRAFDTP